LFLWVPSRKKLWVQRGFFMGLIMEDEISEDPSACHEKSCKILWVPIMPGTRILWVPDFLFYF
jgi:hypothetical protein